MCSVEKKYYGVASGIIGTARAVGMAFSMGITSLIMLVFMGNVQIGPEYYPDFLVSVKIIFLVFTILCFIGIFASIVRGTVNKEIEKKEFS